jgi:hypothetical protein
MAMWKLFGLIPRAKTLSPEEFHDYYRHPHGTVGMSISSLRHYVQNHQIDTDLLGETQRRFEAVAELSFSNEIDVIKLRTEPAMAGFLNEDERNFIDLKETRHFIGKEVSLSTGAPAVDTPCTPDRRWDSGKVPTFIKLLQFFNRCDDAASPSDHDRTLAERLNAFRYMAYKPADFCMTTKSGRPVESPFVAAHELCWPTLSAFRRATIADTQAFFAFIDKPNTHTLLTHAERFR